MIKNILSIALFSLIFNFSLISAQNTLNEVKKLYNQFDSTSSYPATLFSVYFNSNITEYKYRFDYLIALNSNLEKINQKGDIPYNPREGVDNNEFNLLTANIQTSTATINQRFENITNSYRYLTDIYSRYDYMSEKDKPIQATTVMQYIRGETILPEFALSTHLPQLTTTDCMKWLDDELSLLAFKYDNNDGMTDDFEDYSRNNLAKCVNYITLGYSMLISAKQQNGDMDTESTFEKFKVSVDELMTNHESSIKKKVFNSYRKNELLSELYETDGTTKTSFISSIITISCLIFSILLI